MRATWWNVTDGEFDVEWMHRHILLGDMYTVDDNPMRTHVRREWRGRRRRRQSENWEILSQTRERTSVEDYAHYNSEIWNWLKLWCQKHRLHLSQPWWSRQSPIWIHDEVLQASLRIGQIMQRQQQRVSRTSAYLRSTLAASRLCLLLLSSALPWLIWEEEGGRLVAMKRRNFLSPTKSQR